MLRWFFAICLFVGFLFLFFRCQRFCLSACAFLLVAVCRLFCLFAYLLVCCLLICWFAILRFALLFAPLSAYFALRCFFVSLPAVCFAFFVVRFSGCFRCLLICCLRFLLFVFSVLPPSTVEDLTYYRKLIIKNRTNMNKNQIFCQKVLIYLHFCC